MLSHALPRTVLRSVGRSGLGPSAIAAPRVLPKPWAPLSTRLASTKRFTEDHEWIEYDDSTKVGVVGITDYAQKSLGDVVFVELPTVEAEVSKGDEVGSVESVKAASDIFAPVSGKVTEVNEKLREQSNLLNRSPENDGWLVKLELSKPEELDELLTADAYAAHCEGQDQ